MIIPGRVRCPQLASFCRAINVYIRAEVMSHNRGCVRWRSRAGTSIDTNTDVGSFGENRGNAPFGAVNKWNCFGSSAYQALRPAMDCCQAEEDSEGSLATR